MLALATMAQPKILILDEPMNGLDPNYSRALAELIRETATKEKTCVLISSQIVTELARISDDLLILGSGRTLYHGSVEDFIGKKYELSVQILEKDQCKFFNLLDKRNINYEKSRDYIKIYHIPSEYIGQICVENQICILHLSTVMESLEKVYFSLTADHARLRAN